MTKSKAPSPAQRAVGGSWVVTVEFIDKAGKRVPRTSRTVTWAESFVREHAGEAGWVLKQMTRDGLRRAFGFDPEQREPDVAVSTYRRTEELRPGSVEVL